MELNNQDKKRLIDYYQQSLATYGPHNAKAFHWLTSDNQIVRFEMLCNIANLSHANVLDAGCGVGDLYRYLDLRFIDVNYTGIDIVPSMIAAAKEKYPRAQFEVADIFSHTKQYDYVLASGALTFHVSEGKQFYFAMIEHMFDLAKKALGFNMLDLNYNTIDKDFLPYAIEEVLSFCKKISTQIKVVKNYELGDFTVYLYKTGE